MHVRPATPEDAVALPALHSAAVEAFGPASYDAAQVAAWAKRDERKPDDYDLDEGNLVVADRDGAVAGFGHVVADEREVRAVYVHPDHAGRGVGAALLAHLEGYARGRGLAELELASSQNAVGFYERAGYEPVEETVLETRPGVELPVTVMRKDLRCPKG